MISLLIGELIAFVGGLFAELMFGRTRGKVARRGVFLGGLRVVSGRQAGLSAEWLVGEWHIRPGRLKMDKLVVPIVEMVKGSRRPAHLNELVGAGETIVVTLRTETAVLEWSMLRRLDSLALRALGAPESSAPQPETSAIDGHVITAPTGDA